MMHQLACPVFESIKNDDLHPGFMVIKISQQGMAVTSLSAMRLKIHLLMSESQTFIEICWVPTVHKKIYGRQWEFIFKLILFEMKNINMISFISLNVRVKYETFFYETE